VFQKPHSVGGKAGMIETRFVHLHISKNQRNSRLYSSCSQNSRSLRTVYNAISSGRFEQPLGRNRRSPDRAVHPVQYRRQPLEHRFRQLLDPPKWMPWELFARGLPPSTSTAAAAPRLASAASSTSPQPRPLAKTNYLPICFRLFQQPAR